MGFMSKAPIVGPEPDLPLAMSCWDKCPCAGRRIHHDAHRLDGSRATDTEQDELSNGQPFRRLAEIPLEERKFPTSGIERRLAAIPLPESTLTTCAPITQAIPETPEVSGSLP